ncbi:hypothetical protein [Roseobacter sp. HKCCA0434]|uniref:hypothetical protein n=1 Tax=Roseobacter sp. HKCCA0434 TaxID=3079297 RepID=UPI002905A6BF|nr:hypothetical protein [Roseobacter sp. HKCCA0434]
MKLLREGGCDAAFLDEESCFRDTGDRLLSVAPYTDHTGRKLTEVELWRPEGDDGDRSLSAEDVVACLP